LMGHFGVAKTLRILHELFFFASYETWCGKNMWEMYHVQTSQV
jgi:hypothetical protein